MSLRLKALLIAFQVSILMWGMIVYAGYSLYTGTGTDVDLISTASTK